MIISMIIRILRSFRIYEFAFCEVIAFCESSHLAKIRILRSFRIYEFAFCENSHFTKFSHAIILFAFCENYANLKWALRSDANAKFRKIFAKNANFANFACESTSLTETNN